MSDVDNPWAAVTPPSSRRMLLAAIDAFAEQGYHATTTRDIATRSGLSPAGLYVHYPSKAALLAQISRIGHEAALTLVLSAADPHDSQGTDDGPSAGEGNDSDGGADAVQRLRRVVARFVAWHAEHHRVARVVQYELAALPSGDRAAVVVIRHQIETLVEQLLRDGVAEGSMAVTEPRRVARAILSMGVDVARWYDPAGRDSPTDLGALYADLAERMVAAEHAVAAEGTVAAERKVVAPGRTTRTEGQA
jgi:AcrR family transcriptional regulator